RPVCLARQGDGKRLCPDMGLAAKAATDLGGGDPELRRVHAQELGALVAINEVALGAHPHLALSVGPDVGKARMRLDIALVRLFGPEGPLDDDIGLLEALLDISV